MEETSRSDGSSETGRDGDRPEAGRRRGEPPVGMKLRGGSLFFGVNVVLLGVIPGLVYRWVHVRLVHEVSWLKKWPQSGSKQCNSDALNPPIRVIK